MTKPIHAAFNYYPPRGDLILMGWCRAPRLGIARSFPDDIITANQRQVTCIHCKAKMLDWKVRQEGAPMPMECV